MAKRIIDILIFIDDAARRKLRVEHLLNNVAVIGTLEEVNSYYPYGMLHGPSAMAAGVQPLKYGAKELDQQAGLDLYDSRARQLDPLLGRTTTQDPLAEKYSGISPYLWCAGNPVRYTDPTGKDWIVGANGKVPRNEAKQFQRVFLQGEMGNGSLCIV